jgi:hypothetical protein
MVVATPTWWMKLKSQLPSPIGVEEDKGYWCGDLMTSFSKQWNVHPPTILFLQPANSKGGDPKGVVC